MRFSLMLLLGLTSVTAQGRDLPPGAAPGAMPVEVAIGTSEEVGPIFTTANGFTLYATSADQNAAGVPRCSTERHASGVNHLGESYGLSRAMIERQKSCLEKWPPLIAPVQAKPVGKWTVVKRREGFRQWAYDGQPLYTSNKDKKAGDISSAGYGRRSAWHTIAVPLAFPPGVRLMRTIEGLMLATNDRQLLFAPHKSAPIDALDWSLLPAPEISAVHGAWAPAKSSDGTMHWTYNGQALYRPGKKMTPNRLEAAVSKRDWQPIIYQKAAGSPIGLTMHYTVAGWVYADARGRSLYTFGCNDQTPSNLYCDAVGDPAIYRASICGSGDDCAREWQPLLAPRGAKRVGDWDVRDVPHPPFRDAAGGYGEDVPTVRAWTYQGEPVYTFAADRKPGDINGHTIRYYGVSMFSAIKVLGHGNDDGEHFLAEK